MILIAFAAFVLANLADFFTTLAALKRGALEANPIVHAFIGPLGPVGGIVTIKALFIVLLGLGLYFILHKAPALTPLAIGMLLLTSAAIGFVAWRNTSQHG